MIFLKKLFIQLFQLIPSKEIITAKKTLIIIIADT